MTRFYIPLFLAQWLALAVAKVYTGFNYGAFWHPSQAKFKKDFVQEFNLAKTLPNTPVPFDSARLFTCIQWFTKDEPIEAFDAAIETNTSLLLGFWAQNETMLDVEVASLEKAFKKHGAKLADLVVGLSIGNEDIYRFEHPEASQGLQGASEDQIKSLVQLAREKIKKSSFAAFMVDRPIGHTDIQDYVPSGMDFIGMNTYPYYSLQPIEKANESFFNTLANVRKKAGDNTPVWIAETGWPFSDPGGKSMAPAVASAENMQRYWTEVGCFLFGQYNTWWFQLHKDSGDGADWGLIDVASQKPRIEDLSCPNILHPINEDSPVEPSMVVPSHSPPSIVSISSSLAGPTSPPSASSMSSPILSRPAPPTSELETSTITGTVTQKSNPLTPAPELTIQSLFITGSILYITDCLTVADVSSNGQYVSVAMNPAVNGHCALAPPFSGLPYNPTSTHTFSPTISSTSTVPLSRTVPSNLIIPSTACQTLFTKKNDGQNKHYVPVVANTVVDGVCAYPPMVATGPQRSSWTERSMAPILPTVPVSTRIWATSAPLTRIPSTALASQSSPVSSPAISVTSAGMSGFVWPTRSTSVRV